MPLYNQGKSPAVNDLTNGTFKVLLVTSSYTPNVDHDFVSDVVANEATGTGYSRKTIASASITIDDTNDRVDVTAANLSWTGLTSAFRYAILYKEITNDAASPVIAYFDLGAQSVTATDVNCNWSGGVLYRLS